MIRLVQRTNGVSFQISGRVINDPEHDEEDNQAEDHVENAPDTRVDRGSGHFERPRDKDAEYPDEHADAGQPSNEREQPMERKST